MSDKSGTNESDLIIFGDIDATPDNADADVDVDADAGAVGDASETRSLGPAVRRSAIEEKAAQNGSD